MLIFMLGILILPGLYLFLILPRLSGKADMRAFSGTMFAHRGYHNKERLIPENSMPAFRAALAHGYGIELDVHLTKDGHLAVFHDDTLERMCHVPGSVESYTYEELKQFHLLDTDERIPLFTDVLSYVDGRVPLLIELKFPTKSLAICPALRDALSDYSGPYLIQSFNTMGIRWFKLHAPEILRGQLSSNLVAGNAKEPFILRFFVQHLLTNFLGRPDFISYKLKDLPNPSVSICRQVFKIPVAVWTLRTPKALDMGISGYDMQIFEKKGENY